MEGNKCIAQILKGNYEISDLTCYEDVQYEIEKFSDKLSKVTIKSKTDCFFPVYALFDGYYMSWYGDYGFWGFWCTWETNISNLAYSSPYYQLEKLESRERNVFNSTKCEQDLLKAIREGFWYQHDLSEEQKKCFEEFWNEDYSCVGDADEDCLYEYQDEAEKLKELQGAIGSDWEWLSAVSKLGPDDDNLFDCEYSELYSFGKEAPCAFFIVFYMLSVVANMEAEKGNTYVIKGND